MSEELNTTEDRAEIIARQIVDVLSAGRSDVKNWPVLTIRNLIASEFSRSTDTAELSSLREALDNCEAAMTAAIAYVPKDLEIALRERVTAARAALNRKK